MIIQYHQTRASFVRLSDIRAVADVCNKVVPNLIYEIRGKRVMLDSDLARLYGVETRALKQAVRRNIGRFPSDFMFELSIEEYNNVLESSRSQFVTLEKKGRGSNTKYKPFWHIINLITNCY